jgi:hypothetical protein
MALAHAITLAELRRVMQFETMPGGGVATSQQQGAEAPPELDLPTDFSPAGPSASAGGRVRATLPPELSAHMIPCRVVLLDAFPRTAGGKVDRMTLASDAVQG